MWGGSRGVATLVRRFRRSEPHDCQPTEAGVEDTFASGSCRGGAVRWVPCIHVCYVRMRSEDASYFNSRVRPEDAPSYYWSRVPLAGRVR